ncbi:MAG TPA: hypothetical protein PLE27_05870 [Bacteroidia bacterium]|mgnify:CR=1 FL=1|jgi:hypothetical protein|nr:hypothetical protein [Bacteroidia bacterium]
MTKQIYILLIATLGFFLTPTLSYACGKSHTKTEKSCCDKKSSQTEKKDCCKNHSDNEKDNDGCGGKCGHSSCHCPTVCFGCTLPFTSEPKYNVLVVSKKQFFPYSDPYISSGFHSIWLPPKIG